MEISKRKRFFLLLFLNIFTFNPINILLGNSLIENRENIVDITDKEEEIDLKKNYYFLGPGDVIHINFLNNKDFSGPMEIIADGSISLPIVGSIFIEGLTLNQATKKIQNELSKELLMPEIQIVLLDQKPINVAIIGEVSRPGFYTFEVSNSREISNVNPNGLKLSGSPTLITAIQKAGGITNKTNLKEVILLRKTNGEGTRYKQSKLNLLDGLQNGSLINNPRLFDGDRIKLQKAISPNNKNIEVINSNLYPDKISVTIIGEVKKPGTFLIPSNSSLNQAIMYAGGTIDWAANKSNTKILRINQNGTASLTKHKLNLSKDISEDNPLMKDGDIVKINSSILSNTTKVVNAFTQPFDGMIKAYGLFKLFED